MLEETSTPSLPLDEESDDTVLLGLDLDTTYSTADDHEHPPPPVLLAYVSDGTVQAWHVSVMWERTEECIQSIQTRRAQE